MDNPDPYEEPFAFPQRILDQVSECSPDGFLLFVIDENGDVEMFKRDSADIIETGLRAKALKILGALNAIEDGDVTNSIIAQRQDQMPPEGDDDSGL